MIPKAEIHVHIEGTAHPDLVRKYARKHAIALDGLFDASGSYAWHDFTSFITAYDRAASVFRTEEAMCDLAHDYARRCAAEGTLYLEVFASPDHAADAGLSYGAYLDGLDAGFEKAETETGILTRIIIVGVRHLGADAVAEAARLAATDPHPRVTGFGMAGDERFGHLKDFAHAFAVAEEAGLGLTVHAGELDGADSVRAALDHLPVTRIGHGVRAIEDPDLVRRLADARIVLEICPGSNVALGVFADLASHPFRQLMDAGVPVTLNSDDPPFFRTSIGAEYGAAAQTFGLGNDALLDITRTSIKAGFVDEATKTGLLARLELFAD